MTSIDFSFNLVEFVASIQCSQDISSDRETQRTRAVSEDLSKGTNKADELDLIIDKIIDEEDINDK